MSTWIEMLSVENATGSLKEAYDLAKTPAGTVDNVMRIHSQRPHTMVGHLTLYRSVLHIRTTHCLCGSWKRLEFSPVC